MERQTIFVRGALEQLRNEEFNSIGSVSMSLFETSPFFEASNIKYMLDQEKYELDGDFDIDTLKQNKGQQPLFYSQSQGNEEEYCDDSVEQISEMPRFELLEEPSIMIKLTDLIWNKIDENLGFDFSSKQSKSDSFKTQASEAQWKSTIKEDDERMSYEKPPAFDKQSLEYNNNTQQEEAKEDTSNNDQRETNAKQQNEMSEEILSEENVDIKCEQDNSSNIELFKDDMNPEIKLQSSPNMSPSINKSTKIKEKKASNSIGQRPRQYKVNKKELQTFTLRADVVLKSILRKFRKSEKDDFYKQTNYRKRFKSKKCTNFKVLIEQYAASPEILQKTSGSSLDPEELVLCLGAMISQKKMAPHFKNEMQTNSQMAIFRAMYSFSPSLLRQSMQIDTFKCLFLNFLRTKKDQEVISKVDKKVRPDYEAAINFLLQDH